MLIILILLGVYLLVKQLTTSQNRKRNLNQRNSKFRKRRF